MKTEWAFLAGLGVGAVAALMVAPQSGKETQELVADKLKTGLDEVNSAGRKIRGRVKDLAKRGQETVGKAVSVGQEAYQAANFEG
jgi:gas vesicle protein